MRPAKPSTSDVLFGLAISPFLYSTFADLWGSVAIGLATTIAFTCVSLFWPTKVQEDDDVCRKCFHERRDHHGNCQECLRRVVRKADDAPEVPCAKFAVFDMRA